MGVVAERLVELRTVPERPVDLDRRRRPIARVEVGLLRSAVGAAELRGPRVWIWWCDDPSRLSDRARGAISAAGSIGVAAVSCWEVAMFVLRGRLALDRGVTRWVRQALARPGVAALTLTPQAALTAALLEGENAPTDPADRFIYATAREAGAPLLTRDERLRGFDPRGTLW